MCYSKLGACTQHSYNSAEPSNIDRRSLTRTTSLPDVDLRTSSWKRACATMPMPEFGVIQSAARIAQTRKLPCLPAASCCRLRKASRALCAALSCIPSDSKAVAGLLAATCCELTDWDCRDLRPKSIGNTSCSKDRSSTFAKRTAWPSSFGAFGVLTRKSSKVAKVGVLHPWRLGVLTIFGVCPPKANCPGVFGVRLPRSRGVAAPGKLIVACLDAAWLMSRMVSDMVPHKDRV